MDRYHLMNTYLGVVDAGGFAGAARRLHVSPAAVTRAVAELERLVGVTLLTRTSRLVRPTAAGARYAEDCRRILADIAEAEETASGIHGEVRGKLKITAPALFGTAVVMPIVTAFLREHPEVDIDCLFVDRVVSLVDEGVDVAFRIGELPASALHASALGTV